MSAENTSNPLRRNQIHRPYSPNAKTKSLHDSANTTSFNKHLHSKDFDLTFSTSRASKFFADTLPPSNRRRRKRHKSKTTNKKKKSDANDLESKPPKLTFPAGTAPCPQCQRIYPLEDLKIHSSQCALLRAEEESSWKAGKYSAGATKKNTKGRRAAGTIQPTFLWGRSSGGSVRFSFTDYRKQNNIDRRRLEEDAENFKNAGNADESKYTYKKDRSVSAASRLAECDKLWNKFERNCNMAQNGSVTLTDVPFLPDGFEDGVKVGKEGYFTKGHVRTAMKRWHPDKFWQTFGSKLCIEQRKMIMEKVKDCFQRVNALKGCSE